MTKQYKEEDILIYYEGDKNTILVPNGITFPNTDQVYSNSYNWHIAVRSSENVVKFVVRSAFGKTEANPRFQILHGYNGWPATENLIRPVEFFTKKILKEICKVQGIELSSKDTKEQIIDKIRKTAVARFNEIEMKTNPDYWEVGEVVLCQKILPCVITNKSELGIEVAYYIPLKKREELEVNDGYPIVQRYPASTFSRLGDVDLQTLMGVVESYIKKDSIPRSKKKLLAVIREYGEKILAGCEQHDKDKKKEKEIYEKLYGYFSKRMSMSLCCGDVFGPIKGMESQKQISQKTLEIDMRDVNEMVEAMNNAIAFIKAKSGASLEDQAVWKQLQRSVARIEATMKYGPH